MIRVEGLSVRAGSFSLEQLSIDVPTGSHALVIGPTGSGKSTLLEAIAGHASAIAGRITLHGIDCTRLPPEQRGVGIVHQHYLLFPHLTVGENIAYGLRHLGADAAAARVQELAALLGIAALLDRATARLSGGEQQRTALARALAPGPRVLLLDEPFAAVDPATRRALRHELQLLHAREGTTTLQVTHDVEDALRLGDQVTVLEAGRVVQQGAPDEVFRRPNSPFVAHFVGAGTVLAGVLTRQGTAVDGRFPATFASAGLTLDVVADREGPAHAVIRPEELLLSLEPLAASGRNQLRGVIVRLEPSGGRCHVVVDVGTPLSAALTTASVEALDLRPGTTVWLTLKATAVHLL